MEEISLLFSDNLETNEAGKNEGVSRWVRELDGQYYFLPPALGGILLLICMA